MHIPSNLPKQNLKRCILRIQKTSKNVSYDEKDISEAVGIVSNALIVSIVINLYFRTIKDDEIAILQVQR